MATIGPGLHADGRFGYPRDAGFPCPLAHAETGKALRITVDAPLSGEEILDRGIAYVWQDRARRGYFDLGTVNPKPEHGGDGQCAATRRPMLPRIEAEGVRPVDTIIRWLTTSGFGLPISSWSVSFVDHPGSIESQAYA